MRKKAGWRECKWWRGDREAQKRNTCHCVHISDSGDLYMYKSQRSFETAGWRGKSHRKINCHVIGILGDTKYRTRISQHQQNMSMVTYY